MHEKIGLYTQKALIGIPAICSSKLMAMHVAR